MCFGSRKKDEEGNARSRELDKVIRQDEKRMAREVKLLLLGTYPSFCLEHGILAMFACLKLAGHGI